MSDEVGSGSFSQERIEAVRDLLDAPITVERLHAWVEGSDARTNFLAGAVWGHITWDRTLGRPDSPTLAEGFVIEHQKWVPKIVVLDGIPVDMSTWRDEDDVVSWDLPGDEEHRG